MRALSIRQPFAELILRGTKTIEYRSRPTRIIGERFWIYASKGRSRNPEASSQRRTLRQAQDKTLWSRDLAVPGEPLPPWMIELAEGLRLWKPGELPVGVIVGLAVVERCEPMPVPLHPSSLSVQPYWQWHLTDVTRLTRPRKPERHPQPAWFRPF
jgi:hypothetical protein